ncbi:MAG: 2-C-methyl-D-erythritol 4-phosphate cytidylyltransferase [Lachnospiraceae bacterium]
MEKKTYTAIVLAAGKGQRMNSAVEKQFLLLRNKPIVLYSLLRFQESAVIDDIILVTDAAWIDYCRETMVEAQQLTKVTKIIAGGRQRYDSVYAALRAMGDTDYVMIHDAARPLLAQESLLLLRDTVEEHAACALGVPAKDTIKRIDDAGFIVETPVRESLWNIQTPQVFATNLIQEAYELLQTMDKTDITDDTMVVERTLGTRTKLVFGGYQNIKITTPEDMKTAEMLFDSVW